MQVKRNFTQVYAAEQDPWAIGNADSERYAFYYTTILPHVADGARILDIGCGQGAFLARFTQSGADLFGLEYAEVAIERGQKRFPQINFYQGSAAALEQCSVVNQSAFDVIILSDIIYYLNENERRKCLSWISTHLTPNGVAFIAGYCPGKDYLRPLELENLIRRELGIISQGLLSTQHAYYLCRKMRSFAALTYDYETWHPIPEGKKIDWDADILMPTEELLNVAQEKQTPLTFFVEMGEILWLQKNDPAVAQKIVSQVQKIATLGHDVQLHLHPSWLPELGASHKNGQWHWDWQYTSMASYPGNLTELIGKIKAALEEIVNPVKPDYRVTCFRSGAYACQPFKPLYDALLAHGIYCDSSVYPQAVHAERGYDFTHAYSSQQPYFASAFSAELKAPPAEERLIEIPITVLRGNRLQLDGEATVSAIKRIREQLKSDAQRLSSEHLRCAWRCKSKLFNIYCRTKYIFNRFFTHKKLKNIWKKSFEAVAEKMPFVSTAFERLLHSFDDRYPSDNILPDRYFVCIGHTKCCCGADMLRSFVNALMKDGVKIVAMSCMAKNVRPYLSSQQKNEQPAAAFQVSRECKAVLAPAYSRGKSEYLQALLPLDRKNILVLGCGADYEAKELHEKYPWVKMHFIDSREDFIVAAKERYGSDVLTFSTALFINLPFKNCTFDAIYADNTLEHAHDVQATLAEAYRVLGDNGCLVAAIPPDAYNSARSCDNHKWKTTPQDVRLRLEYAGFTDIRIQEIHARRMLGEMPFPPSRDKMLYIMAWKRGKRVLPLERAIALQQNFYERIEPASYVGLQTAERILAGGQGLCADYACVLLSALRREGYCAQINHIHMHGHVRGRGADAEDTHTLVEAVLDNRSYTFDPTLNIVYPASIEELRKNPHIAKAIVQNAPRDARWARGYDLYCSIEAWQSVVKISS